MIRIVVLITAAGLGLVACGKKAEPVAEPVAAPKAVNIAEAGNEAPAAPTLASPNEPAPDAPAPPAVPQAEEKQEPIQPLTEQGVAMLNYAVYKFREETGRNPKSLQEMIGKTLPRMPQTHPSERLVYDPQRGQIKVEKVK